MRMAELDAQERIARMRQAELDAEIELEMAPSNATHSSRAPPNNHGARPSLHAGSRAPTRADAPQLQTHNLQVVLSDTLLPIPLQTTADMAGPTGTNCILPTNDHLDGCSAARTVATREGLRPSTIPLADQSSSQAFLNHPDETRSCHMGNQGVSGHFGPQTSLRHPTSEPVSFQPPVQQPCAVAPGTQANCHESRMSAKHSRSRRYDSSSSSSNAWHL